MMLSLPLLPILLLSSVVPAFADPKQTFMQAPMLQHSAGPSIADLLTVERSVSIFYSYARETQYGKLLDDPSKNITVLAPTNKAVIALPRKPHQGPERGNIEKMPEISQIDYDALTRSNVEKWVGAHIILDSLSLEEKEETYQTLLPGQSMNFRIEHSSREGWARYVINDEIEIISKKQASNGVVFLIDGTALY